MSDLVLLTGATGYVGGRLLRQLEEREIPVRCLVRQPEALEKRVSSRTELYQGDIFDPESIEKTFQGVQTAYYLIHSMGAKGSFKNQDRKAAENFLSAAKKADVKRIVYLGGLGSGKNLSDHLASRQEVGEILRSSGIPTIEFRSSIIIGSGSLSFEIIRALVQRLPIMTTPKWVRTRTQPISIEDVIAYLIAAYDLNLSKSKVYEIGGPDLVSYRDLLHEYARQRGLKRWIIPVPVLSPGLSSLWLDLITPVYARIGRPLIESLRNETIVQCDAAEHDFTIQPRSIKEAIARALLNEDQEFAETRWSGAFSSVGNKTKSMHGQYGNRIINSKAITIDVPTDRAFKPIQQIGGANGWYYSNWLWKVRGFLDRLVGGVGLRRGRRDAWDLTVGDAIDFWRVEKFEPKHLLRLRAEMKLPGRAWLQFEVEGNERKSTIRQTAIFDPLGLMGLGYWYLLYPLHGPIFNGMLKEIGRRAQL